MAESDASEISVVNLVDLSDQIDAELSQEGGGIAQCRHLQPLRHKPSLHKPYREGRSEQPGGARLAGGAEGGRYGKLK